jgi:hypothetical protein
MVNALGGGGYRAGPRQSYDPNFAQDASSESDAKSADIAD